MKLETLKLSELKPYPKNARKHPLKQIDLLAKNIEKFGFNIPILITEDNEIIAGHGRLLALQKLGKTEVPCVRKTGLTLNQIKALRVADNRLAEMAEWDMGLLLSDLKILSDDVLDLTGFDKDLLIEPNEKDDQVPEVPVEPKSKLGDLYELGNHRVLCGDSTKKEEVERLMDGKKAELLFTSPPYSDLRTYGGGKDLSVLHLSSFIPIWKDFVVYQIVNLGLQRKDNEIFQYWNDYILSARDCGYKLLGWNVWAKDTAGSIGSQKAFFPIQHEWIFVFGVAQKEIKKTENKKSKVRQRVVNTHRMPDGTIQRHFTGKIESLKKMGSFYLTPSEKITTGGHPAVFPVKLPEKYITVLSDENDIIGDPFLGSGSTLIACEKTGRICFGQELEPCYIDVIVQRWCDYTGNDKIKKNGKEILWRQKEEK